MPIDLAALLELDTLDPPAPPAHIRAAKRRAEEEKRAEAVAERKADREQRRAHAFAEAEKRREAKTARRVAKAAQEQTARMERLAARAARKAAKKLENEARKATPNAPRSTQHPLYQTYRGMLSRCYTANSSAYPYYGGRGISVCSEWIDDFWAFVADMGERPAGTSLDRVNNDGDYEPANCRWADKETQYSNTLRHTVYVATIRGRRKLVAEWAREKGVSRNAVVNQIRRGVLPDVAVVSATLRKQLRRDKGAALNPTELTACLHAAQKFCTQEISCTS